MRFFVASQKDEGKVLWARNEQTGPQFCRAKMESRDASCLAHYRKVFATNPSSAAPFTICPYGLLTSKPLAGATPAIVISGLGKPQEKNEESAEITIRISDLLPVAEQVSAAVARREYDHLEAAVHEVRHLNASITQHSEVLLRELGSPLEERWDMSAINADPAKRSAFSVFAASRDLSLALSMHELSRSPASAGEGASEQDIFNLFVRQKQIASAQLKGKGLTLYINPTNKVLKLSRAFRLIPKILIDNALKYAASGSRIEISFVQRPNAFRIICRNFGRIVRPGECDFVFYRGYRGENSAMAQGSGIGLWLAKLIVNANGGSLKFEVSESNRNFGEASGTTEVSITLAG
jgi:signal transduction histidine kinase